MSTIYYKLAVLALLPAAGVLAKPPALTMQVLPTVVSDSEVSLLFRLRYEGKESFDAKVSALPGVRDRPSVVIDATRFPDYDLRIGKACGELRDIIKINDPDWGWHRVRPGQEFVETIKLSELYTGISDVLGRCDVVLNWSYKMYTRDNVRFPRIVGSVVIPSNLKPVIPPNVTVSGHAWQYEAAEGR